MINTSKIGYSDKWATPKDFYETLNKEFQFNFDPCPITWKEGDLDGLQIPWGTKTFCNPPYSKVAQWIKKASEECDKGNLVVLLVNCATDTKWFHEYVYLKHEVRFVEGRLKFINPLRPTVKIPAPRPSMVIVMRP